MRPRLVAPLACLALVTACSTGASPPDAAPGLDAAADSPASTDAPAPSDVPPPDAPLDAVAREDAALDAPVPDVITPPDAPAVMDAPEPDVAPPLDAPAVDAAPPPDVPMPDAPMPDVPMADAGPREWATGTFPRSGAGRIATFRDDTGTLHITASLYTAATLSSPARTQLVYGTWRAGTWGPWDDIAQVREAGEYYSDVVVHRGVPYIAYMRKDTLETFVIARGASGWSPETGIPVDPPPVTPATTGTPRLASNGTQLVFSYLQSWSRSSISRTRVVVKNGDTWGAVSPGPTSRTPIVVVPAGPRAGHFAYGSEFTRDMREVVGLTYIDPTTGATSNTPAVLGAADWAGPERLVYMLPMALMFRSDGRPTLAYSVTYECGSYACSALQFAEGSGADPATLTLRSTLFDRTLGAGFNGASRGAGGVNYFAYSNRIESGGTVATIVTLRADGTTGTFDVPSGSMRPYNFALPSYEGFGFAVDPATRVASFVTPGFGVTQGTIPE